VDKKNVQVAGTVNADVNMKNVKIVDTINANVKSSKK
jgi:hypothetical protein